MVEPAPSCALSGGFAVGAPVALLWQHNANPSLRGGVHALLISDWQVTEAFSTLLRRPGLRASMVAFWQPSSVSGRSSTVLQQSARQRHVSQFVVGFPAATETYTVPAVIPRHYHVTFLNCNTHSGPNSGIATKATLKNY